jgi:hypothetical protein
MRCERAAEVISWSVDTPLSAGERVGLGVHTLLCGACRRYRRQLLRLHTACATALWEGVTATEGGLSAEARVRIAAALDHGPPVG